ncbi:MAG: hypothetical protein AAGB13_10590 [Cyanobacteria bacterium P01_F01_bin.33]
MGLQDEIFQGARPVLVGVDAASTYCYLLQDVDQRDEDSWGCYLLDVIAQGFRPDYTIADAGAGLRAGQKAVMPDSACYGDVFHIQQQFVTLSNSLSAQAKGVTSRRRQLEERIARARVTHQVTRQMNSRLVHAKLKENRLRPGRLILTGWKCWDSSVSKGYSSASSNSPGHPRKVAEFVMSLLPKSCLF